MSIETFPINLYKTNIEFQQRITQLLQEYRQHWLAPAQQGNAGAITKTEAQMEDLLQSAGWQSLMSPSPEIFGRLFQASMSRTHTMSQTAIRSHTEFTVGFQHALQDWQTAVTELLGRAVSTQSPQNILQAARKPAETTTA